MLTTRRAEEKDGAIIAEQRRQMFADAGFANGAAMTEMVAAFERWVSPRLGDGTYLGWLVEDTGDIVGGAGLWLMDFPPHWMDAQPVRAYLLNFYTAPTHRGQGIAGMLLKLVLAETRRRGIKVATLHASPFGKPIYEKNGFLDTNEMMLRIEV